MTTASPNKSLDRMTRSAFTRVFQVEHSWRAPRHQSVLRSVAAFAHLATNGQPE